MDKPEGAGETTSSLADLSTKDMDEQDDKPVITYTEATESTSGPKLSSAEVSSLIDEFNRLRTERKALEKEILRIAELIQANEQGARPMYHCKRCGYDWLGRYINKPPRNCPRCHSSGWNEDPMQVNARKPSDPPNPRWYQKASVRGSRPRTDRPSRTQTQPASTTDSTTAPEQPADMAPPPKFEPPPQLVPPQSKRFAEEDH